MPNKKLHPGFSAILILVLVGVIVLLVGSIFVFKSMKQKPAENKQVTNVLKTVQPTTTLDTQVDRNELKDAPIYPKATFLGKKMLTPCEEPPYNLRMCDSNEYSWYTTDDYEKVVTWYENDTSNSSWKLSGGAGSWGTERFGNFIKEDDTANNWGMKILSDGKATTIYLYIPYNPRAH